MERAMIDSGIDWIGSIPENWKVLRNKNCFELEKSIVGDDFEQYELLSLTKKGIVKKDIENNSGKIPESYCTYQTVKKGQIVMCLFDLDMSAVFSGVSDYDGMISPAYKTYNCKKNIYNQFAKYWFEYCFDGRKYKIYSKSLRYVVNADDFGFIEIVIPPMQEQKKIAQFLDDKIGEIDAIISRTKISIEEYKKYKLGVITEAVLGVGKEENKYKDVDNIFIKRIPIEWELCKLKYLSDEIGDGLHSTPEYDDNGDVYFINGNNIGGEYLEIKSTTNKLNDLEYSKYKKPLLNAQTIMIALNGATYGKLSFYNFERVLLGKSAGYITLKNGINKRYIKYYLQSSLAKNFMSLSLNGTTIQNLSLGTLNEMLIIVPTEAEQQEIVECLDIRCKEIDALIKKKEAFIEEMEIYKRSLIYEYVTGKKEVV